MHKVESMKSTGCAKHMRYARDLRPALYQGLYATAARLGQRGWLTERVPTTALARASPRSASTCWNLGGLSAPKNKVALLETSGTNFAAMEAAQSLLEASTSHSGLKTIPLKEQLLLLELSVSEHSRGAVYESVRRTASVPWTGMERYLAIPELIYDHRRTPDPPTWRAKDIGGNRPPRTPMG